MLLSVSFYAERRERATAVNNNNIAVRAIVDGRANGEWKRLVEFILKHAATLRQRRDR